jgi:PPP family 3-phenylpropionic acid transporter
VLALRLYYLSVYVGLGAVLPLLAISMQARGFRASQYAWLVALLPLSRLLAPPLWGAIADKWSGTARLLRFNTLIAALAMALLSQSHDVVTTIVAFAVWAVFSSSLVPLAEAGTYALLGGNSGRFALIRVFGSIGFALSALAIGVLGVDRSLSTPFLAGTAGYLLAWLLTFLMPVDQQSPRIALVAAVARIARRKDVLLLWGASTLYYVAHGAYDVYFGPHVRSIAGMDDAKVSLSWAIGVVAEIILILFVPRLLGRKSSRHLLLFAALVSTFRWVWLAYASSVAMVWLTQPLHAVTFALWYLVLVHENQMGVPEEVRATVQGFVAASLGLGMITATVLGGYVIEALGGRTLFLLAAASALLSGVLYAWRTRLLAVPAEPLLAQPHAL